MGVVLMLKWQLICHQKCVFGLLILYQLSFWYLNSYHAAKRKKLSQIYLPYNQFLLPYKRSIFTIKVAKMIWFLEKSTLYPDLPYKRLPYKWSALYGQIQLWAADFWGLLRDAAVNTNEWDLSLQTRCRGSWDAFLNGPEVKFEIWFMRAVVQWLTFWWE